MSDEQSTPTPTPDEDPCAEVQEDPCVEATEDEPQEQAPLGVQPDERSVEEVAEAAEKNPDAGDAKTRQYLSAQPEDQREPFRQRPVQESTVPIATTVDEEGTITRQYHKPGAPVEEQEDEVSEGWQEYVDEREELSTEPPYQQPEVPHPAEGYLRPNIVHPGPTPGHVALDEVAAGAELEFDPSMPYVAPAEEDVDRVAELREQVDEAKAAQLEAVEDEADEDTDQDE